MVTKTHKVLLPYIARMDLERWTDKILRGVPAAVVLLLLALYQNLKTLCIHYAGKDYWREGDSTEMESSIKGNQQRFPEVEEIEWGNVFHSLATVASIPEKNKMGIFSRLSDFHFESQDEIGIVPSSAGLITRLQALPAMRRIRGRVVHGRNVRWPYGRGTSGVTELDLVGDIGTTSLSNLISGIKALERFRYHFLPPYDSSWREDGGDQVDELKWGPHDKNDTAKNAPDEDQPVWIDEEEDEDDEMEDDNDPNEANSSEGEFVIACWEPRAITASL